MAVIFKYEDRGSNIYYASIPILPIIPKSYILCVFKSVGFINSSAPYLKKIGRVLKIIPPHYPEHQWWEFKHAKDYVIPKAQDTLVVASFPRLGEEMFLPKDIVHVMPIHLN